MVKNKQVNKYFVGRVNVRWET